jgi:hypothetical protein
MDRNTNLYNLTVTPDSGKDVSQTQQLKGTGKMSAAQKDTNEQKPHTTGAAPSPGKLGGLPSRT